MRREEKKICLPVPTDWKGWSRVGRADEKQIYAGEQLQLLKASGKGRTEQGGSMDVECPALCHVVPSAEGSAAAGAQLIPETVNDRRFLEV